MSLKEKAAAAEGAKTSYAIRTYEAVGGKGLSLRPSPKRSVATLSSGLSRRNATLTEAASPRFFRVFLLTFGFVGERRAFCSASSHAVKVSFFVFAF